MLMIFSQANWNRQACPMQHQRLQALSWVLLSTSNQTQIDSSCLIPNSVFGPYDNFDAESGHVLSSLISRFHKAREIQEDTITLWGTGEPLREFIFSEDLADAIVFLLEQGITAPDTPINIGSGHEISISALANLIKSEVGFTGDIIWDNSKPNGSLRKLLDTSVLQNLGWSAKTNIKSGIKSSYEWYLTNGSRIAA